MGNVMSAPLDIDQLQTFVAIADTGSFTRAAERVFKTLIAADERYLAVGIVPVDVNLDLKALATALGRKKLTMADPTLAERTTGMIVGGISPIGQKRPLPTVVDSSALDHETILVSGGRRGLDVELAPADLVRLTAE